MPRWYRGMRTCSERAGSHPASPPTHGIGLSSTGQILAGCGPPPLDGTNSYANGFTGDYHDNCCSATGSAWVVQFDVADALVAEGRMELYNASCGIGVPPQVTPFTKLHMPVFTRLVPAGEEQVHYSTDLGAADVRVNVGIYNAGSRTAQATLAVHQPMWPGTALVQTATIPPDSFVQIGLPHVPPCGNGTPQSSTAYTTVTVDQPSLSLVSTLINGVAPNATAAVTDGN
jgi:hypothetical protein